jgi:nucleotide-binding universal stress UspA family protein
MKQVLTPDQVADLAVIHKICDELKADLIVIGATSLLLSIGTSGVSHATLI